jgi:uncharacterized protein (TIGR04255 family)
MPVKSPFPDPALPPLKRPPIELIIGQVRVPLVLQLLEPAGVGRFYDRVKRDYPHLRREEQVAIRLSPEDAPRGESVSLWRLEDAAHAWTLTVAPDYVAIETREYQAFDEFRDRLVVATSAFVEVFEIPLRLRVGLRYVDRFDREKYPYLEGDWLRSTSEKLLGLASLVRGVEQRSFVEHRLALSASWGLTFRASGGQAGDAGTGKDELTLDVDAFNLEEAGFQDLAEILVQLKRLNYGAFAWAAGGIVDRLERRS